MILTTTEAEGESLDPVKLIPLLASNIVFFSHAKAVYPSWFLNGTLCYVRLSLVAIL